LNHEHADRHPPRRVAQPAPAGQLRGALRLGIGGPVGSGKTALVAALCMTLRRELALAVVTNDIYTTEDADFLRRAGVLADGRIRAVRTGCCPHTAIRDDIAANLAAAEDLEREHAPLDLLIIESGGDNLTAIFSQGWWTCRSSCSMCRAVTRSRAREGLASASLICWSSTRPTWPGMSAPICR